MFCSMSSVRFLKETTSSALSSWLNSANYEALGRAPDVMEGKARNKREFRPGRRTEYVNILWVHHLRPLNCVSKNSLRSRGAYRVTFTDIIENSEVSVAMTSDRSDLIILCERNWCLMSLPMPSSLDDCVLCMTSDRGPFQDDIVCANSKSRAKEACAEWRG